ncbi:hypothetical protein roselon_01220 [Roseibacterium elongatum DSM 19469]|uniref:Uncharacterized protein n=1 Tax=Roseicyclus elongatus DSM 19469 TaxID=1294273 RepID=W8S496_9RHOB|nr:hypothetical protein roselon_01220 [Roseibacterium elongatum DSM 19469]
MSFQAANGGAMVIDRTQSVRRGEGATGPLIGAIVRTLRDGDL